VKKNIRGLKYAETLGVLVCDSEEISPGGFVIEGQVHTVYADGHAAKRYVPSGGHVFSWPKGDFARFGFAKYGVSYIR
jgi:prepilin-type processing-associated H-X9-DG protein